ncbi:metallophosphoesterase family protein [Roseofilum sp. BLCC_M143]|uniref:Metallophosphoesterase family protein n=2 Tax=Roseofilum TaxID=1233426 RepID=A0ABT7C2N0_9CYAN|nr:metallophosphoesterase family protein [Roseofilum casamattae]MDJ1185712.1 metallophosphoesterase family protein [Roseofilum casamattae BLCC-M143]
MVSQELLTDPFLQFPTEDSVRVVWFTEFSGSAHYVQYGENLDRTVKATTTKLTQTKEDKLSHLNSEAEFPIPQRRDIWRHEAEVVGLNAGKRVPYHVISIDRKGDEIKSETFTLAPRPIPGEPLKILLTSDHQLKPMTAANLQKVEETIGEIDGIFFAGDLVNIPDRASEWFDDSRGNAFFPLLQGRGNYELEKNEITTTYTGASLIQYAPLFPALGNHEIMGKQSEEAPLNDQFNDSYPRAVVEKRYGEKSLEINPSGDPVIQQRWIEQNSFNSNTYEQIFSLPESPGNGRYYAVTFGDIRLVVPTIANMWRSPSLSRNTKGRYRERDVDLNQPENWGYGQHIFETITPGSQQYQWLVDELNSPEFQQAKYKIVMFHHPPHSLGDNVVPAYTDPMQKIDRDPEGNPSVIRYEYPRENDYIIQQVLPLLERANVDVVFYGHSHLWNRFVSQTGMNFLETSNVGNSYGANVNEERRFVPPGYQSEYAPTGDPNGLEPIIPTLAPIVKDGQNLPYIADNNITVFTILDTETETISSYRFDTRYPDSEVIKFDEFKFSR